VSSSGLDYALVDPPLLARPPSLTDDPATPTIHTLSLHDALPIFPGASRAFQEWIPGNGTHQARNHRYANDNRYVPVPDASHCPRSEEHTSELQSRENLVCRLLLEKKKNIPVKRHDPAENRDQHEL